MSENKEVKQQKNIKASNLIVLIICVAVLIIGLYFNVTGSSKDKALDEVKSRCDQISEGKYINLPGVALINVGVNNNVRNMNLLVFGKKEGVGHMRLIGVRRDKIEELCFRDEPKTMYKAIEQYTGYKVGHYIIYNNDTLKEIMDIQGSVEVYVNVNRKYDIDDIEAINSNSSRYAEQYGLKDDRKIAEEGLNDLNTPQLLAYANAYYDEENGTPNVVRRNEVLRKLLLNTRYQSLNDMERTWNVIHSCKNDYNETEKYDLTAAIKKYRLDKNIIWPK